MLSDAERDKLDDLHVMYGVEAGNLALALEQLTDAMGLVNLHAVYCRVEKGPQTGRAPLDVQDTLRTLESAKRLVQDTMQRLRTRG
jgi:hypothetical protein